MRGLLVGLTLYDDRTLSPSLSELFNEFIFNLYNPNALLLFTVGLAISLTSSFIGSKCFFSSSNLSDPLLLGSK